MFDKIIFIITLLIFCCQTIVARLIANGINVCNETKSGLFFNTEKTKCCNGFELIDDKCEPYCENCKNSYCIGPNICSKCPLNFGGLNCEKSCPSFTYGFNCEIDCFFVLDPERNKKYDTKCILLLNQDKKECEQIFKCRKICKQYKYGNKCDQICKDGNLKCKNPLDCTCLPTLEQNFNNLNNNYNFLLNEFIYLILLLIIISFILYLYKIRNNQLRKEIKILRQIVLDDEINIQNIDELDLNSYDLNIFCYLIRLIKKIICDLFLFIFKCFM